MPVTYNFRRGANRPRWYWLTQPPLTAQPGVGNDYDGVRYIYYAIQSGSTTAASTTSLYRFDTWTHDWLFVVTLTNGYNGIDIEYDGRNNVLWLIEGNTTTAWRFFNLNAQAITLAGAATAAWTLSAALAPVLPATATIGASLSMANDVTAGDTGGYLTNATPIFSTTAVTGSTSTVLIPANAEGHAGMVGCAVRFTSGALAGQVRTISAATSAAITVAPAFGGAPANTDAFVVEFPTGTATSATASTLVDSAQAWTVNQYANADVIIPTGIGAGQRRRIASNTATTLTLAGAVAGAGRTGNWTITPDNTSTYRIVPSADFLYFLQGNTAQGMFRADISATTVAWTTLAVTPAAPGGGANLMWTPDAPWEFIAPRGSGTSTVYAYHAGLNTWRTLPNLASGDGFSVGATSTAIHGRRRIFMWKDATVRCYLINMATGEQEGAPQLPYAAPNSYDSHRVRYVRTADGVEFVYALRAGGQEFWRTPLNWQPGSPAAT